MLTDLAIIFSLLSSPVPSPSSSKRVRTTVSSVEDMLSEEDHKMKKFSAQRSNFFLFCMFVLVSERNLFRFITQSFRYDQKMNLHL